MTATDRSLPPRARSVLRLVVAGYTNKHIAAELRITEDAVVKALQRLRVKLLPDQQADPQYSPERAIVAAGVAYFTWEEARNRAAPALDKDVMTALDRPLPLRARSVLRLVVAGYTNKHIAAQLQITEDTVVKALQRLRVKLLPDQQADPRYSPERTIVAAGVAYFTWEEARNRATSVLDVGGPADTTLDSGAAQARGTDLLKLGRLQEVEGAWETAQRSFAQAERLLGGRSAEACGAALEIAVQGLNLCDYAGVATVADRMTQQYAAVMDPGVQARLAWVRSELASRDGQWEHAERHLWHSIALATEGECVGAAATSYHYLGRIYAMWRDQTPDPSIRRHWAGRAETVSKEAQRLHRLEDNDGALAFVMLHQARWQRLSGQWDKATESRDRAKGYADERPPIRAHIDLEEARIAIITDHPRRARRLATSALDWWIAHKFPKGIVDALQVLGMLHDRRNGPPLDRRTLEVVLNGYVVGLCLHPHMGHAPEIWARIQRLGRAYPAPYQQWLRDLADRIDTRTGYFMILEQLPSYRPQDVAAVLAQLGGARQAGR